MSRSGVRISSPAPPHLHDASFFFPPSAEILWRPLVPPAAAVASPRFVSQGWPSRAFWPAWWLNARRVGNGRSLGRVPVVGRRRWRRRGFFGGGPLADSL